MILDAPNVKDCTGRELHRLHNVTSSISGLWRQWVMRRSGAFLTSIKTIFEWQKHSQSMPDISYHQEILDFINLHAQMHNL